MLWVCAGGFLLTLFFGAQSAPYFPIEISRMLESCWKARITFVVTLVAFAFTVPPTLPIVEALCVSGIVMFDDRANWTLHMLFVLCLFVYIIVATNVTYAACAAAALVYSIRFVLKGITLGLCEGGTECLTVEYAQSLMLGTFDFKSAWTRAAFQVAGVCQWLAFAIIVQSAYVLIPKN